MSKAKALADTLNSPTQPRPTDDAGRELDEFGLPINGPARLRALNGLPDPSFEPEAAVVSSDEGEATVAAPTPSDVETQNG